jgi:hypothetical protein
MSKQDKDDKPSSAEESFEAGLRHGEAGARSTAPLIRSRSH